MRRIFKTTLKMMKKLKYLFLGFITWFVTHSIVITIDGLINTKQKADLAVILGNKVNEDGTLSERLKARVDCGFDLYKLGQVKKILVSGGLGKEGYCEGTKMKEYLIRKGVPNSVIFVDDKGKNTLLTVRNTLSLRDSIEFESIIVVSQYYHLTRTKMLFRKNGFDQVWGASPSYFEMRDFYSIFREFFAFYSEI